MTPHPDHEQRLTDLEVKAAFSEDQLDHEVRALRERQPEAAQALSRQPRDDLPPHY